MTQLLAVTRMFRKSTPSLLAAVIAIGLLANASRALAVTMTWTNGDDVWNSSTAWTTNQATGIDPIGLTNVNCVAGTVSDVTAVCVGGTGGFPATGDTAWFTNNHSPHVTVNITTNLSNLVFSNTFVTIGATPGTTLTVTGALRVAGDAYATSTVYWAGGNLGVTNSNHGSVIQIGNGTNSSGAFFVTNGTVAFDENTPGSSVFRSILLGSGSSAGKLVVSGPGVVTNGIGSVGTITLNGGPGPSLCQLIITNGGKVFMSGSTYVLSNGLVLVSGPTSSMTCTDGTLAGSGGITIGGALGFGASTLIVSNGAKVSGSGTICIGRSGSSCNTGVVSGAGSQLISAVGGFMQVGSTTPASSNDLVVADGGFLNCVGGTFTISDSADCINNSLHMGGQGGMSTGQVVLIRNNTGSANNLIVVTNAVLTAAAINSQGTGGNLLSVLAKGTVLFTNQYAVINGSTIVTNVLNVSAPTATVLINAGTISALSGSNAFGVEIGSSTLSGSDSMIITNGGKLLSELGTFGANSSFCTGIVTGVGSIWSNVTAGVSFINTNSISIGGATSGAGGHNILLVQDGATVVNNGSFDIGDSGSTTFNSAVFGGAGAPALIVNNGFVDVGGASGTSGNTLLITNAVLDCDSFFVGGPGTNRVNNTATLSGGTILANAVRVRATNTLVFTAGTLSSGGTDIEPIANGSNAFVVGDGVSAAFYDMSTDGDGYHGFSNGGLVVTNGASLRGSGTISGTINVLGTLVPGFAGTVGTIFTSNSLSLGPSTVLNYDLGTSSDTIIVNGNLDLGNSTLNVSDSGGFAAGIYVLFTYTNTLSAPPGTITVGSLPAGFTAVVSNDIPNAQVLLVVSGGSSSPYSNFTSHYGLTGANALGTADPDGDGMDNTNEFQAGFSPINSSAYLHITSVVKTGADVRITYLGANGDTTYSGGPSSRTNVLEFTTGTVNGSYSSNNFVSTGQTNILSGGTGVGLLTNMIDVGGATNKPSRYYRIRVLLP